MPSMTRGCADQPEGPWPRLVYDLGAAEGYDSAQYLDQGYKVVAVEPRPDAVAVLRERFAEEIAEGRLIVIAKGIAEQSGSATFWLCEDNRFCSSFNRGFMTRWGHRYRAIEVPTVTFRELLNEYGRATYWKIDIEGSDHLCFINLCADHLPRYLSVEIVDSVGPLVRRLTELGFRRFKLISQLSFDQPSSALARAKMLFRRAPAWLRSAYRSTARMVLRTPRRPRAASGPFGEDTPGRWLSADQVVELAQLVRATDADTDWYDLHAALSPD